MDVQLLIISLIIGVIFGAIVRGSMLSQLKSVIRKNEAAEYVRKNSFKVSQRNDLYLYKKLDKQMIQRQQPPAPPQTGNRPRQQPPAPPQPGNRP